MLILELKEILQDLDYNFFKHIFLEFLKTSAESNLSYHIKDTNHDIYLNFSFQSRYKVFLNACYLHL